MEQEASLINEKKMDRRKMRYKEEVQRVNSHYFDEVLINGNILKQDDLDEVSRNHFQKRFDHAAQLIRTSLPLKNLTVPESFVIHLSELPGINTKSTTKEEHVANLNILISDREQLLKGIQNLYKGTAKKTENCVRKEIEGLLWCRDKVQEEFIVL